MQHSRNLTETMSPTGTTQDDRNSQRLYLGWKGISWRGHQALPAEQKLLLLDKCLFEPQKRGRGTKCGSAPGVCWVDGIFPASGGAL